MNRIVTSELIEKLKANGIELGPSFIAKPRDCNDVQKYIQRMYAAHEATKNSKLRFGYKSAA